MTQDEVKEFLCENGGEEAAVFDGPCYNSAFIGVSHDGRAVYDYELMIEQLVVEDGMSPEEAIEFIDYNTIRAIPYFENAPIVLYKAAE